MSVSRRSFLAGTGLVFLAAACGKKDDNPRAEVSGKDDSGKIVGGLVSPSQYASTDPQRFAFALTKSDRYYDGVPAATITFVSPTGETSAPADAPLHADGLPEGRGIYATTATTPTAGVWTATIEADGQRVELPFEVTPLPNVPLVGSAAIVTPSPTPTAPLGTDPICTREPGCGLHKVSLDQLLGKGRPVALMFATPARCESQYCGPVLDLLLDVKQPYADQVDFVHVEIYQSDTGAALVPTIEAWKLDSEPWLFGVDGSGTIVASLGGAFDRTDITDLLDELVAPAATPAPTASAPPPS